MGYRILGYVVWQGGKWYVRRRLSGPLSKVALAGIAGAALLGGGALVVQRRAAH